MPDVPVFKLAELGSDKAVKAYQKTGCLQIPDFLPAQKVDTCLRALGPAAEQRLGTRQAIVVGDERQMISVPLNGPFNDRQIFAADPLKAFFEQVLGKEFLLSCVTCVVALPGAAEQHLHRDYVGLFDNPLDNLAPSFAINLFVPLVPLNRINGTTRLWPGSHRPGTSEEGPGIEPELTPGEALIMDYRVLHQGTANVSNAARPVLTLGYSRSWFLDARHFEHTNPLEIDEATLAEMRPEDRNLFARAGLYRNAQRE